MPPKPVKRDVATQQSETEVKLKEDNSNLKDDLIKAKLEIQKT